MKYSARNITSRIVVRPEILAEYLMGHKRIIRIMTNVSHAENEHSDEDDFLNLDNIHSCNFELTDVHFNDRKSVLINNFVTNAESMWSPASSAMSQDTGARFFQEARDCPLCLHEFKDLDKVIQLKCNKFHIYH